MAEEQLYVWRFTPVARTDDPAWQSRKIWADFRIVASTAGQAIQLASRREEEQQGRDVSDSQDRQQLRSGFEDALLYRLDRLAPADSASTPAGTVTAQLPLERNA